MTHSVIIFKTKEYRFRGIAEYVLEGLRSGDRITAVLDSKTLHILKELLGYFGFPGDPKALHLLSAENIFLYRTKEWRDTLADLKRIIFGESYGGRTGAGGVRTVFDMTYFLSSQRNYDRVLGFEGEFHDIIRRNNADALCTYFYEYIPDFFYEKLCGVHSSIQVDPFILSSSAFERADPFSSCRVEEAVLQLFYSALHPRSLREAGNGTESKGDLPRLFSLIPDICLTIDLDMNITCVTANCADTLGYRKEELEGKSLDYLFSMDDFLLLEEKVRSKGPASAVFHARSKEGENTPLLITARDIAFRNEKAGHLLILRPLEGTPLDPAAPLPGDGLAEKLDSDIIGEREFAIIRRVLQEKRNKEIAAELNLAEITIKKQLSEIYRKLQVRNRTELIKLIQRIE
ncbi:MAG: MEDS domain-containing protein [Spirochaetia bacterium]